MDAISFTEICLHQLKMSGVHEGEKLVVLTQGSAVGRAIEAGAGGPRSR